MKFSPLTEEERAATGFTHRLDFSYQDIPAGIVANTSTTWSTGYLPAIRNGDVIKAVQLHLTTPFAVNPNDSGFTSSTLSLGDVTTATRYINASEANINGTEVINVIPGAATNVIYTAAGQLILTLNSMAAKSLSSLNVGKGYIFMNIDHTSDPAREKAPPFTGGGNT
jgi:hypothetical protein